VAEVLDAVGDDVCYVFRHFPLIDRHPHAPAAAEFSERAAEHGLFWEAHGLLFQHQDSLTPEDLAGYARTLGLPNDPTDDPAERGSQRSRRVQEDIASALAAHVNATPTFFVNGRRHVGPTDAATLLEALRAARDRNDRTVSI
jgi:protein-disulfide isomerase